MSTQKQKFELFARLQSLGFTYEEAAQLRRIEMTLHRWSEAECNGDIQRSGPTGEGKPFRYYGWDVNGNRPRYAIADREAGALRRLKAILFARNNRAWALNEADPGHVYAYHQGDPRGCALYLITRQQITQDGKLLPLDQYYTRGLAVCA